jgi:hypothetical protein
MADVSEVLNASITKAVSFYQKTDIFIVVAVRTSYLTNRLFLFVNQKLQYGKKNGAA